MVLKSKNITIRRWSLSEAGVAAKFPSSRSAMEAWPLVVDFSLSVADDLLRLLVFDDGEVRSLEAFDDVALLVAHDDVGEHDVGVDLHRVAFAAGALGDLLGGFRRPRGLVVLRLRVGRSRRGGSLGEGRRRQSECGAKRRCYEARREGRCVKSGISHNGLESGEG
jgi:hypothetical protein